MCKVSKILKYFVFIATTLAIAGVFYEGMAMKWFNIVGVFILIMDVSFIISTLVNIFNKMDVCKYFFNSYDNSSSSYETILSYLSDMVACVLVFLHMVCVWNTNKL